MKILLSGASGLVGSEFRAGSTVAGDVVVPLVRQPSSPQGPCWMPERQQIDAAALEGFDAVVHLAGENLGSGRWNAEKKRLIRSSRVQGTELLCRALAGLRDKPKVLVSASAIGFYGNRGEERLDEQSPSGTGFLADVCRDWEAATRPAWESGIRVVQLRMGVVLSPRGGALAQMLSPFRLGGGGPIGSGRQYWSWISLNDAAQAIRYAIANEALFGAVNAVTPNPVTNSEFTRTLGRVLQRPTLIPIPAFAIKLLLGEMAEELLLSSTRVVPAKLQYTGFQFVHPNLETALRALLDGGA